MPSTNRLWCGLLVASLLVSVAVAQTPADPPVEISIRTARAPGPAPQIVEPPEAAPLPEVPAEPGPPRPESSPSDASEPAEADDPPAPLPPAELTPEPQATAPPAPRAMGTPRRVTSKVHRYRAHSRQKLQRFIARMQATHWGYASQAVQPRPGFYLDAHRTAQIARGHGAQLALYRYDFLEGDAATAAKLSPHGRQHLARIAELLLSTPFPLVIEQSLDDPDLDAARRAHVLAVLGSWSYPIDEDRVTVGQPEARGMSAEEATEIHQNLLQQTRSGGPGLLGLGTGSPTPTYGGSPTPSGSGSR
jgi:hypothetical protein